MCPAGRNEIVPHLSAIRLLTSLTSPRCLGFDGSHPFGWAGQWGDGARRARPRQAILECGWAGNKPSS